MDLPQLHTAQNAVCEPPGTAGVCRRVNYLEQPTAKSTLDLKMFNVTHPFTWTGRPVYTGSGRKQKACPWTPQHSGCLSADVLLACSPALGICWWLAPAACSACSADLRLTAALIELKELCKPRTALPQLQSKQTNHPKHSTLQEW